MAWEIDPAHSRIEFSVRHLVISDVRGHFGSFTGSVAFDEQNPTRSSVSLRIDAASISTEHPLRDAHLKSPDFLDVERYQHLRFESTRVEAIDACRGRLMGRLTIRDVTREVALDVQYAGQAVSPWGRVSAGFRATTTINRQDWGLVWNQDLVLGGVLVGDLVAIRIDVELLRVDESEVPTGNSSQMTRTPLS